MTMDRNRTPPGNDFWELVLERKKMMPLERREFLATLPAVAASAGALAARGAPEEALRTFLRPHVLERATLDRFWIPGSGLGQI